MKPHISALRYWMEKKDPRFSSPGALNEPKDSTIHFVLSIK